MSSTYQETIQWMFQQFPAYQNIGAKAYKPGLNNIKALLSFFDNPQNDLSFIHVAGTNGKGSTCSMLASILTEAGNKVGLFTSPHIHDFRERIRVNGQVVDESFVVEQVKKIQDALLDFQPSFFEISFLLALLYFKQEKCSICVIETGLGGRLDATNCIVPILSLITNISIEHTQYLGNTIAEIAQEKAGIIKKRIPVIIGERVPESAMVFTKYAEENQSKISFASDDQIYIPTNFPLLGDYQQTNFKLVVNALKEIGQQYPTVPKDIELGLANLTKNTGLYGRMQVMERNPTVIFDVSHNEAGIKATLDYFKTKKNVYIIYGSSADKDLDKIMCLFPKDFTYYFTEFSNERSASLDQLKIHASKYELKGDFYKNPKEALIEAKRTVNKDDTILVFGSFFLIADFF
ncbi:MAG: bifunctional folylpolyglutamate synthase/dihydrofolate synthase [Crocinitomicaceae bacterium]|nr:bifunctional folylpolyglutamate synthase/dihydrofolate synthase [Crocinitomicaceae bacterium]